MRTEGLAVVKNESDIIEAFVRHNLQFLDALHVIDNASTDGTDEILTALAAEGLPVFVTQDPQLDHPQAHVLAERLRTMGGSDAPDWVFCLDADEFILVASAEQYREVMAGLDPSVTHLIRWEYFVPTPDDDADETNPLLRITHRRDAPVSTWLSKVIVPRQFLGRADVTLAAGNHLLLRSDGTAPPHAKCPTLLLGHFPVRSADQLAKKVVIGDWAISSRMSRGRDEGHHWSQQRRRIIAGERLTPTELTAIAANYGSPPPWQDYPLVDNPMPCASRDLHHTHAAAPFERDAVLFADDHFATLRGAALVNASVRVTKTGHGLIAHRSDDDLMTRHLERLGEWAAPETDFVLQYVAPAGAVVDVKPGVGTRLVAFSVAVQTDGLVLALEPDRVRRQLLCATAALNGLENVEVEPLEPGDGQTRWTDVLDELGKHRLDLVFASAPDDLIAMLSIGGPVVARDRPAVFCFLSQDQVAAPLVEFLTDLGYQSWWHLEPAARPENFAGVAIEDPQGGLGDDPRVAILGLPEGGSDPGLVAVTGSEDSWLRAWEAQGRKPYRAPVIWEIDPALLDL